MATLTPFLWFDDRADEALEFYATVFADSAEVAVSRGDIPDADGGRLVVGSVQIAGLEVKLFNGGPGHPFNDAVSLFLSCADQAEVDRYWDALVEGGEPIACGWVRDRFGVTWQVIPDLLGQLLGSPDAAAAERALHAMMSMMKIDCAALQSAFDGAPTTNE
ncbi:MAG: VOC family protein [Acidimicrobiales bacterium]